VRRKEPHRKKDRKKTNESEIGLHTNEEINEQANKKTPILFYLRLRTLTYSLHAKIQAHNWTAVNSLTVANNHESEYR
jgi:hypothetical protein